MGVRGWLIHHSLLTAFRLFCRVKDRDFSQIPLKGPGILISNHNSNLEGPYLYLGLSPRSPIALAKAELWKLFFTRQLMKSWKSIPVRRGRLDRKAVEYAAASLKRGRFLGLAPEGRRSRTGELQRGQPGAAWFALDKEIPVYPIAQWGFDELGSSLRRGRRARVTFRVGRPFVVRTPDATHPVHDLQSIIDEMMFQIALLLPEARRGVYQDFTKLTTRFLHFL